MQNLDVSPQFDTYSKVIIHIDDDTQVSAGNDSGRVMEVDNPLGTQALAREMLEKLRGFRYQPYQADGALLDPAAEIGDAVNTPSVYGGIYTRSRTFGRLMQADVSAPCDEEINHEYVFESPQERKFTREMSDVRASFLIQSNMIQAEVAERKAQGESLSSRITQTSDAITAEVVRASAAEGNLSSRITQTSDAITAEVSARQIAINGLTTTMNTKFAQTNSAITAEVNRASVAEGNLASTLSIQADEIAAKVSASGGSNTSGSFSWNLTSDGHRWYVNGQTKPVMSITATGLSVRGTVTASAGKIGGFDIGANALSYNGLNWGDTDKSRGAYIGQSGIQLGKYFKVDNQGNVLASSLKLKGTLTFLNSDGTTAGTMSAADLRLGAQRANTGYSSWDSAYGWTSGNGSYCTGGVGNWYNAQTTSSSVSYFKCTTLSAGSVSCSNLFGANLNGCKVQISGGSYSIGRQYDSDLGHWVLTAD